MTLGLSLKILAFATEKSSWSNNKRLAEDNESFKSLCSC